MKRAMVGFRGAREKGAMAFVDCLGASQKNTMEGPLWRSGLVPCYLIPPSSRYVDMR